MRYVISAGPGEDLYMVYSTVYESVQAVGGKQEIRQYLIDAAMRAATAMADEQLCDADEFGSSAPKRVGWDDACRLRIMQGAPYRIGGDFYLPRARMHEYAQALRQGDSRSAQALLVFEPYGDNNG